MRASLRVRLAVMMFLEYAIWGSWYVTLNTYLTSTLHFSGAQAGAVFGTTAVASVVSPFFVGLVADRYFSTERVMAALYALGAACMLAVRHVTSVTGVYALLLAFCLCFFPTISLTNSLTMRQVTDPGRDFPPIRTMGTLGWIVIGLVVGFLRIESSNASFLLAAALCLVMCAFSLAALPHTPPRPSPGVTARSVAGLDALAMMKDRTFLVFAIASVLACIPLTFYYSFTNTYLNEVGVINAAGKMTIGQMSEVLLLLAMPVVFRLVSVRTVLLIGLAAWCGRYLLLGYGNATNGMWMFYAAIALHGICYDFFFVTGQLYADQVAPDHLRSTAQGFMTFATYGLGMLIGSFLSGYVLDYFSTGAGGTVSRDWTAFWLSSSAMAFAILVLVLLFFRTPVRIHAKKAA